MEKNEKSLEMQELIGIPKHVLFAAQKAALDSYFLRSFELRNLLGRAVNEFQNAHKKIFGVLQKDTQAIKIKYFSEINGENNIKKWKELESKRRFAKKAFIISDLLLQGKDVQNIHPIDFLDEYDEGIRNHIDAIESLSGLKTYLFEMWDDFNYFIKPS